MIEPAPNRLRDIRKQKGYEPYDIAAHIRKSVDTVVRWEKNEGGPIPSKYIPTLAAFLEVEPAHLMGWDRLGAKAA